MSSEHRPGGGDDDALPPPPQIPAIDDHVLSSATDDALPKPPSFEKQSSSTDDDAIHDDRKQEAHHNLPDVPSDNKGNTPPAPTPAELALLKDVDDVFASEVRWNHQFLSMLYFLFIFADD